jgi:hypothetical protein
MNEEITVRLSLKPIQFSIDVKWFCMEKFNIADHLIIPFQSLITFIDISGKS